MVIHTGIRRIYPGQAPKTGLVAYMLGVALEGKSASILTTSKKQKYPKLA